MLHPIISFHGIGPVISNYPIIPNIKELFRLKNKKKIIWSASIWFKRSIQRWMLNIFKIIEKIISFNMNFKWSPTERPEFFLFVRVMINRDTGRRKRSFRFFIMIRCTGTWNYAKMSILLYAVNINFPDTSENSKLVHRRICTKVDASIFFSFFRRVRATSMTPRRV